VRARPYFRVNLASPIDLLSVFKPTTRTQWDLVTPLALAGLSLFGLAFIYSAQLSAHGNDWQKQAIFLGLGAAIYLAASLIDYRFWLSVAHWFYPPASSPSSSSSSSTTPTTSGGAPTAGSTSAFSPSSPRKPPKSPCSSSPRAS
jgi:hypothetical protein